MFEISDPAVRRRYRAIYNEIERAGGLDVAQVLASLAIHLEQRRNARIERAELVALCSRHEPGRSPHGRARREGADNREARG